MVDSRRDGFNFFKQAKLFELQKKKIIEKRKNVKIFSPDK